MDFREPNPFAGDEAGQVASVAYRCAIHTLPLLKICLRVAGFCKL